MWSTEQSGSVDGPKKTSHGPSASPLTHSVGAPIAQPTRVSIRSPITAPTLVGVRTLAIEASRPTVKQHC